VKAHMLRAGCTPAQAEELVQETMLAVWRKAGQFDSGRGVGAAWIYAIARNMRIDSLRRERAVDGAMFETHADERASDEWLSSNEAFTKLQAALTQLPAEQAQVVRAAFVEHRAHAEIAEVLGLPLGTVKSRLRLALRRLRSELDQLR
jgi:RNA polymerase sigma-70 factor (ECF subfamily)